MTSLNTKNARMEFKTFAHVKDLLKEAAALKGQDVSSFVMSIAEKEAKKVLSDYQSLKLSQQEQENFMKVLQNPAKPTPALKKLMSKEPLLEQ